MKAPAIEPGKHLANCHNGIIRWYDPVTGRWLSKDPIGISGGLNQYVAFGNNPVNFRDPDGLFAKEGYEFWMDVAESGFDRAREGGFWNGLGGYSQAAGASIMTSFIDFWDARGIQEQAEKSGYYAGEECTGKAWKHGFYSGGRIALQGAKVLFLTRAARAEYAHWPHRRGHRFPHIQFGEWRKEVPKWVIDFFKKKL
jgi:hypothetical protein